MTRRPARKGGEAVLTALGAIFILVYFFALAGAGLYTYFSPDDMMNLYQARSPSSGLMLKSNVLFFLSSPLPRPMGSLWYRSIFYFAGFHPLPFHIANFVLLVANLFLTYKVSCKLSDSRAVAALTTLIVSYHGRFVGLYFDTGYIFDVLCYFFVFCTWAWYLHVRERGGVLRWRDLAACCGLYACALDAKEMAVTLPAILCAYEALYGHIPWRSLRRLPGWILREGRGVLATGLMTAAFLGGRIAGKGSLMQQTAYRPQFTWDRFMETSCGFMNNLLYTDQWFGSAQLLVLWVALLAVAMMTRSRTLKFAWVFLMLAPLPMAFVAPRGGPQYYIPLFGWALYAAAALVGATMAVLRKLPEPVVSAVLLVSVASVLGPYHKYAGKWGIEGVTAWGKGIQLVSEQLYGAYPHLPAQTRIYFLNDPLNPDYGDDLTFIARLRYGDDTLVVGRAKGNRERPTAAQIAAYDHVFDYRAGHLIELPRGSLGGPAPTIFIMPEGAEVFHQGWAPVTRANPARRGEVVIARATDLGPTRPAVPEGQPFPKSPLAEIAAGIEARVNGKRAEVPVQIGWPEEVNVYRVDIRMPEDTAPGMAKVELTAGGRTGPAVTIPVR